MSRQLTDVSRIPQFGGAIYYVSKLNGDDANNGLSSKNAFETIGAAISAKSVGDAINITAGTYVEVGLDIDENNVEVWCEIGVIIDPVSGTALTISGDSCKLKGMHKITPAAGAIGLLVSGDECHIQHGEVLAGAQGVQVTGSGVMIDNYMANSQTAISFDVQGIQARLYQCKTVGNAATIGYKISGGVDAGVLEDCTSAGHTDSGYYIDTGSQDWTILHCSSGKGDGRWVDVDDANTWSEFFFDSEKIGTTVFSGATTEYNIFKVTGGVRITDIHGHVKTVIPNTASTVYLQLYSTNGTVNITGAAGVDIDQAVAGAILVRNSGSADLLKLADPNSVPAIIENADYKDPHIPLDVVKDDSADTYIRAVISVALASGEIHWHCEWLPLTDDGFLEVA